MTHAAAHEDVLRECLASEDPARALAASPAAGCAECARRLEELEDLRATLGHIGRDLRGASSAHVPGEDVVHGVLGPRLARRRRARRLAQAACLLAAAAVLLLVLPILRGSWPPSGTRTLGPGRLELATPVEEPALGFSWRAELPEGGWYEIRVLAAEDGRELARATTEETRWTPPEGATDWPKEIVWQLSVLGADGTLRESLSAPFSRSRSR